MGSTRKVPTLKADKIYGHSSPDRMHQRDKLDDDTTRGTRARMAASQPTTDVKKSRLASGLGVSSSTCPTCATSPNRGKLDINHRLEQ